jgi:signal transduction histidine kinase
MPRLSPKDENTAIVLHGDDNIIHASLKLYSDVKGKLDCIVGSLASPSAFIGLEKIWQGIIIGMEKREGVHTRFITEIKRDNLSYCKEIMKFAELRHMDNVQGGILIVDNNGYIATASLSHSSTPYAIYSNAKTSIEQQRIAFEDLWMKAIPAEQRIKEMGEECGMAKYPYYRPKTIVLDNLIEIENIIREAIETSDELLVCSKFSGLKMIYNHFLDSYKAILSKYRAGNHKGIRWVTTIERRDEDIELIKTFLGLGVQVRHLPTLPPMNFRVTNRICTNTISKMEGGKLADSLLVSNEQFHIDYWRAAFEEFWNKGIDAADIIKDIEKGIESSKVEVIRNSREALDRAWKLISCSKKDVSILFSTSNAFRRQVELGVFYPITQALQNGSKVRILIPTDDDDDKIRTEKLLNEVNTSISNVIFKSIDKSLETRLSILIVDGQESLVFELKDDKATNSYDAVGIATYSDSKPIASSYSTIFESLWKQSELYEQLKINDKLQKEFINIAAHELRTPVQPILGFSQLLVNRNKAGNTANTAAIIINDESQHQYLKIILRNAKRLEHLTNDILEVARIESNSLILKKERVNIRKLILSVIDDFEEVVLQKNIQIQYREKQKQQSTDDDDLVIFCDREKIIEVLNNILSNAFKFTEEGRMGGCNYSIGGGIININLSMLNNINDGNAVVITIKDTGPGIAKDILPRLFTKFATKSYQGTGLGLYISKNIIEAHGGRIWAENNANGIGATFGFTLPT